MSRRRMPLTAVAATMALLATPVAAADKNKPEHIYGPEPSWEQFRAIAEAGIQARLIDPESARISVAPRPSSIICATTWSPPVVCHRLG